MHDANWYCGVDTFRTFFYSHPEPVSRVTHLTFSLSCLESFNAFRFHDMHRHYFFLVTPRQQSILKFMLEWGTEPLAVCKVA